MEASTYDLAEIKNGNGNVRTRDVREHDLGLDAPPKSHISLTQIDAGDMYRLGKKQELNVCGVLSCSMRAQADGLSATSASSLLWASPWSSWEHGKVN